MLREWTIVRTGEDSFRVYGYRYLTDRLLTGVYGEVSLSEAIGPHPTSPRKLIKQLAKYFDFMLCNIQSDRAMIRCAKCKQRLTASFGRVPRVGLS